MQARGPGSWLQRPHDCAPLPEVAPGSPSAAMYCGSMRLNCEKSTPDACIGCCRPAATIRDPMARSRRFTDGMRRRTFMRFLLLDDLKASYTNAGVYNSATFHGTRSRD